MNKQFEETNRRLATLERLAESLGAELGITCKEHRLVYEAVAHRDERLRAHLDEMQRVLSARADRFDTRLGRLGLGLASVAAGAGEVPPGGAIGS
ncbi:hypothetical protein [Caldinitratiruptor microaerophilus]|uniref:Uncharacterized protein n=1 Tax=Caldinitratiruptor microaerophilus TaxID=671077 RepID=A0AA35G893_9FIRM|nr:hypothetical protein [Caldinitratiruptor microaerophilus]BDG60770.1 hypothetical protein caldi_18600 [Caldinitratiruptor microaerophilus]